MIFVAPRQQFGGTASHRQASDPIPDPVVAALKDITWPRELKTRVKQEVGRDTSVTVTPEHAL